MTDLDNGFFTAAQSGDVVEGDKLEVELENGDYVLLLRVSGTVFAVCADCPHQDTPLSEGMLDGLILTCPVHFWQWNIDTGDMLGPTELPLARYQVKEINGEIFVRTAAEL